MANKHRQLIKEMDYPLRGKDILDKLDGKTNLIFYKDLKKFNNILDVLEPWKSCVILYPMQSGLGHWTCLFYNYTEDGKPCVEFFDPYGTSVDLEFKHSNKEYKNTPRYLCYLLSLPTNPYPVVFNEHKYQKSGKEINTCGRHVINRLKFSFLTNKQYNQRFGNNNFKKRKTDADEVVTVLTS